MNACMAGTMLQKDSSVREEFGPSNTLACIRTKISLNESPNKALNSRNEEAQLNFPMPNAGCSKYPLGPGRYTIKLGCNLAGRETQCRINCDRSIGFVHSIVQPCLKGQCNDNCNTRLNTYLSIVLPPVRCKALDLDPRQYRCFSILRLSYQKLQMAFHSRHSDIFPLHILRCSLVQFEIESAKQMRKREVELSVCQTIDVSC